MYKLSRARDVEKLNNELKAEKENYASIWAKNAFILEKDNKWEGDAIDKGEKLPNVVRELNKNIRQIEVANERERKLMVKVKNYRHELNNAKEEFAQK